MPSLIPRHAFLTAGWSSQAARQAHNLKVIGSNPIPATNQGPGTKFPGLFCECFFYVIQNPEKRFYIGCTHKVEHRLEQHNAGMSKWTRGRGPWQLVWQKSFPTLTETRKFENLLKRQKGGSGFAKLTGLDRILRGS